MIRKVEHIGSIHDIRICARSPSISHIFFDDDSLFFFRANAEECATIKQILLQYEAASGQAVNFQKIQNIF